MKHKFKTIKKFDNGDVIKECRHCGMKKRVAKKKGVFRRANS